jgi:protoheme IX farnesyltransferase
MRRRWEPTGTQFTTLLAATTIAVYALIATGAALASSGTAVPTQWPVGVPNSGEVFTVGFLLVVGHRLLTAVAGLMLALTLLGAVTVTLDWRARLALLGGAVTFLIQVAIGAFVVLSDRPYLTELHLGVAAAVFLFLLTALAWSLEGNTAESGDENPDVAPLDGRSHTREGVAESVDAGGSNAEPADAGVGGAEPADAGTDSAEPADAGTDSAEPANAARGVVTRARVYLRLTKPRLMWLLCLLAVAGMALATTTGQWPSGVTVAATLAGGVLAIGASGTFNHLYERDRDRQMERTADRPIATERIPATRAALFGGVQVFLSMAVLVAFVNLVAAALTFAAIVYYSVVYTVVLKPNTTWNIAIGGGSGALPALIGWAAVTGSIGLGGLLLAGLVVIWTPAHFYNLAIAYREDYARAGYPMFPVVAGVPAARRRILLTLGGTLLASVALVLLTPLGWLFAVASVVAGSAFFWSSVTQCRRHTREATMRTFFVSIAYLGVLLAAIVVETVLVL